MNLPNKHNNTVELIEYRGSDKMHSLAAWASTFAEPSGVYKITINSIVYIGSSSNLKRRLSDHLKFLNKNKHQNKHLQSSFNKYSIEKLIISILEFCKVENLKEREDFYINEYNAFEDGFNQSKNSFSPLGYKHTEENKKIMSDKKIGKSQTLEHVNKRKLSLIGKKRTCEHKEKYKQSKIGDKNPMFGIKLSEETKKEKSKAMNSVPKWNKGLTKKEDERLVNLGHLKNKLPYNAIKHKLTDLKTNEIWEEDSLKRLSVSCPLSLSTLIRLKKLTAGKVILNNYKLEW